MTFSQLVDTLRAWRGPVQSSSALVARLVALTGCSIVRTSGSLPGEPVVFAA